MEELNKKTRGKQSAVNITAVVYGWPLEFALLINETNNNRIVTCIKWQGN